MPFLPLIVLLLLIGGYPEPALAELSLRGNFTQGGLIFGRVDEREQVMFQGQPLKLSPAGDFIIGFGRDAEPDQHLILVTADGSSKIHKIQLTQRHYKIERINGISKRLMSPSEDDLRRISQEAELVAAARQMNSGLDDFLTPFDWPITGRISGIYGSRRIFNGKPRRPHFGIDIAAPKGTPVKAPAGGRVTLVHQGMFFSGATLIIDHGHGLSSSFLHLDNILVQPDDQVAKGQVIATVGASGRVTGPHLDWRVNWFQERLDPALLAPEMPQKP